MYKFFDKLEDKIRGWFSRRPILYAFLGGVGVVLFWRGVWHTADWISSKMLEWQLDSCGANTVNCAVFPDGPLSLLIGTILLLITGLFVSVFIGDQVIISGLRGEKKLTEKTEKEVEDGETMLTKVHQEIHGIQRRLSTIEREVKDKKGK